jgi:hypothetical protein
MFIRDAGGSAVRALRRHTPLLVVLALALGVASAAEIAAASASGADRVASDASARIRPHGLGHDRAAATPPHASRDTHRSGLRVGATLALAGSALLLALVTRRTRAHQSSVWRARHGYVPRRGPPLLQLT